MIGVRTVLRELGEDEPTRAAIMARFKARGGSLDRWHRRDVEIMADAITRTEDSEELRGQSARRVATRERLRAIRRRLENDLDAPTIRKRPIL